jgi:hypothetical protein
MTLPAHVYRLGIARKGSSMAAVTGRAGGSLQVPLLQEGNTVDTFSIQIVLVGGNAIGFHALFIGVAVGTGGWQVGQIDIRGGVIDLLGGMPIVTIVAGGRVLVPLGQTLAVHALFVIAQLINWKLIGMHPLRVSVTRAT